ncbi:hypothetical protein HRbin02_01439 [Candidatus Calditenuaceae archaeon HR02]|nr:hypothetical protein HRbin02_01439 [Candidatus Calditenuaceae archaeon HR02]
MLTPQVLANSRTAVLGEVRTGKTRLLYRFVWMLTEAGFGGEITVIDMAPGLSWGVGGKLVEVGELPVGLRYLTSWEIMPPRLIGRDAEDVKRLAKKNEEAIRPLLEEYSKRPTSILAINDATIYIHRGEPGQLFSTMSLARAWLVTAYYGSRLADDKGTGISVREKSFVEQLLQVSDIVIRMG